MKRTLAVVLAGLLLASALSAQEPAAEGGAGDEEALFGPEGTGAAGVVGEIEAEEADPGAVLLRSDGVEIGGRFRFDASSGWSWDGAAGPFGAGATDDSLELDLGARLFLDARPSETFRVFGKTDISFPFTDQGGTRSFDEVFRVLELFSDFQLGDSVFFRAGKQTINWGVGWFFSPADLLNITEIDPEDPEAEREGPVALKIQAPVGAHNLYLYAVFEDAARAEEIALAPRLELVLGDSELGVGGFYRAGDAPAAMATLTTSLSDFSLFAEGVLSYGSNRTFVAEDPASPTGLATRTVTDRLFPAATAGFLYRDADDERDFDVSVSAQYLYNGEGYADARLLRRNAGGVAALLGAGELAGSDLAGTGRHYAAVNAGWNDLLGSDFTLACLWLGNLSDGSGRVVPSLRWQVIDELDLSLEAGFGYGEAGSEYAPSGEGMTLTLSARLGSGGF